MHRLKKPRGENPLLTAFGSKGTKALVAKTTSPENNSDEDGNKKIAVACELKERKKRKYLRVCVAMYLSCVFGGGSNFLIRDPSLPSRIQGTQRLLGGREIARTKIFENAKSFCYLVSLNFFACVCFFFVFGHVAIGGGGLVWFGLVWGVAF